MLSSPAWWGFTVHWALQVPSLQLEWCKSGNRSTFAETHHSDTSNQTSSCDTLFSVKKNLQPKGKTEAVLLNFESTWN